MRGESTPGALSPAWQAPTADGTSGRPSGETVELTSSAQLLERLERTLASLPEIDPARVDAQRLRSRAVSTRSVWNALHPHYSSILIRPGAEVDPQTTVADLFRDGAIEITIFSHGDVKIGVQAPRQLSIWRKGPASS